MQVKRKVVIVAGAALVLAAGGAGIANAVSGDDGAATGPDGPAQPRPPRCGSIPGGTANAVERDGENGATWEVEVRRPGRVDGRRAPRRAVSSSSSTEADSEASTTATIQGGGSVRGQCRASPGCRSAFASRSRSPP